MSLNQHQFCLPTGIFPSALEETLGSWGSFVRPRGSGSDKEDKERYCLRMLLSHYAHQGMIDSELTVNHVRAGERLPDFRLTTSSGAWFVEVTEICPPEDGNEMHKAFQRKKASLLGTYGGYGQHGVSTEVLKDAFQYVQDAIERKDKKHYSVEGPIDLLLYANFNANFLLTDEKRDLVSKRSFKIEKFRHVFCIWSDSHRNGAPFLRMLTS